MLDTVWWKWKNFSTQQSMLLWLSRVCMCEKEPTRRTRQGYHIESNGIACLYVCMLTGINYITPSKSTCFILIVFRMQIELLNDVKEMEISTKEGTVLLLNVANAKFKVPSERIHRVPFSVDRWTLNRLQWFQITGSLLHWHRRVTTEKSIAESLHRRFRMAYK